MLLVPTVIKRSSMNERLEEIESKLLHLELAYEELNQVVYTQTRELDAAVQQIEELKARLRDMAEQAEETAYSLEEERPPHY